MRYLTDRASVIIVLTFLALSTGCGSRPSLRGDQEFESNVLDFGGAPWQVTFTNLEGEPLPHRELRFELDDFPTSDPADARRQIFASRTDQKGDFYFRSTPPKTSKGTIWLKDDVGWNPVAEVRSLTESALQVSAPTVEVNGREHRFKILVVDKASGAPLGGVRLRLCAHPECAPTSFREPGYTDQSGLWIDPVLNAYSSWWIWVEHPGFAPVFTCPYQFLPSETDDPERVYKVALHKSRRFAVTVVAEDGTPLPGHWIELSWPNHDLPTRTSVWRETGPEGQATLDVPTNEDELNLRLFDAQKGILNEDEIIVIDQSMAAVTVRRLEGEPLEYDERSR